MLISGTIKTNKTFEVEKTETSFPHFDLTIYTDMTDPHNKDSIKYHYYKLASCVKVYVCHSPATFLIRFLYIIYLIIKVTCRVIQILKIFFDKVSCLPGI